MEMALKNQYMKLEDFFIFWKSLVFGRKNSTNFGEDLFFGRSLGKTLQISVKTFLFFFLRSHHISDQTAAFFRPF